MSVDESTFALPVNEGASKRTRLADAIARYVEPGSTVHVAYSDARPNAALLQVARHFAGSDPGLTIVTSGLVSTQHSLVEMGLVRKVVASFVGENYPTARPSPAFQRAVAAGAVEIESWSLWTLVARLMAGALGLSHFPVNSLRGSSLGDRLFGTGYTEIPDPFVPGEQSAVVAPLRPDVVLLQGVAADESGNVVMAAPYGESMWGALASKIGVIACVERIVSTQEIRRFNTMVRIPAHKVVAVCEVPFGSHPYGMYNPGFPGVDSYVQDGSFMGEVYGATKSKEAFDAWIEKWVLGCRDHDDYLELLGRERRAALVVQARPDYWRTQMAEVDGSGLPDGYSSNELMVAVASRLIADRVRAGGFNAVLAGVGQSNLAAWLAVRGLKRSGVEVELMAEIGMFGYDPRPGEPFIFANRNLPTAKWLSDVSVVLGSLISGPGSRSLGVIGAGQIDSGFNTNSSYDEGGGFLVGSGGANDIASSSDEVLVTVNHDRRRLVEKIPFITSPGGRVRTVVTSAAVFEQRDGSLWLIRYLPTAGADADAAVTWIRGTCPWEFRVDPDLKQEEPPTADELAALRAFDPDRSFLRGAPVASN